MLFQDQEGSSDPFKIPGFGSPDYAANSLVAASNASLLPLPSLLGPPRARGKSKTTASSQASDQEEEVLTAKQPTFEFPPRSKTPRAVSRHGSSSNSETESVSKHDKPPPLGAGIPHRNVSDVLKGELTLQEARSERSISNADFQTNGTAYVALPSPTNASNPIALEPSFPERPPPRIGRPPVARQRSKSNAAQAPDHVEAHSDWKFSTTKEFQFPPPGFSLESTLSTPSPKARIHNRISPTHASASTISSTANSSRSSHQFTQSLDAPVLPHRFPSSAGYIPIPPNLSRSRSATPSGEHGTNCNPASNSQILLSKTVPKKPSMTRLASVAVMETVHTPTSSRPHSRQNEGRSGSVGDVEPPLPGLKDVLKVRCS
jgi:hypothetical protein